MAGSILTHFLPLIYHPYSFKTYDDSLGCLGAKTTAGMGFTGVTSTAGLYYYFFIQSIQSSFGGYKFISNKADDGLINHSVIY